VLFTLDNMYARIDGASGEGDAAKRDSMRYPADQAEGLSSPVFRTNEHRKRCIPARPPDAEEEPISEGQSPGYGERRVHVYGADPGGDITRAACECLSGIGKERPLSVRQRRHPITEMDHV